MERLPLVSQVKQILHQIGEIAWRMHDKTDEMSKLLSEYDVETSAPDELSEIIAIRKTLLDEMVAHQQQLMTLLLENADSAATLNLSELQELRENIICSLDGIIAQDKVNNEQIVLHRESAVKQFSEIRKGKKIVMAYDQHPKNASTFVNIAVSK